MLLSAYRPLLVAAIKLFETLCLVGARLQRVFHRAGHFLLRRRNIGMHPGSHGGEDGCAQRTALIGGDDL